MVFNVELDYFFADHRKRRVCSVVRKEARRSFPEAPEYPSPSYHFESLTFPVPEPRCQAYIATFHPVAEGTARAHEHPGVELLYVLGGDVGVTIDTVEHRLKAGDALYFDSAAPHSYRRLGRQTASALVVAIA
jgi:quercetin dioxygenase-like cupin family protein